MAASLFRTRAIIPVLLLLLPASLAVPAPLPPALPVLQRVASYADIPASYVSIFKIQDSCPDAVTFGENTVDDRQVALLPMASIQEDSVACSGSADMAIVSEATVEQDGLLTGLGLSGFRAALDANVNANNLVNVVSDTAMLVGWHAAPRTCGANVYPPTTIYFVIREDKDFTLAFSSGNTPQTITLPAGLRSLLMITTDNKVCLLVDPSTGDGSDPTLTQVDESGNSVTTVLAPGGSSTAPTTPEQSPAAGAAASPPTVPTVGAPSPSVDPVPPSEETSVEESPSAEIPSEVTPVPSASVTAGTTDPVITGDGSVPVVSTDPSDSTDPADPADPMASGESDTGESAVEGVGSSPESIPSTTIIPEETDDGSACFPADAVVDANDGNYKKMKELRIGDKVADGKGGLTDVIFFTHRERNSRNAFLKFTTLSGKTLTVSPGHYVYTNGGILRAASSLKIGEGLDLVGDVSSPITFIEDVRAIGLYNPQTTSGTLVVDGFKVSTYTTAIHPDLAHRLLMAPVRLLYRLSQPLTSAVAGFFDQGSPIVARLLPSGPALFVGPQ